ncbi:hypothetical protein T4D_6895 [Trichinella pseudospiralis]|uniref:Uncharacterized protein n=1 Tax=Trichinella pseudospiralis TaxID=6337 RepID=A0A0V1DNY9_TRIPS|nr:hypothetical protein T4D_6895 [Trichinella pseudospiralis]
MHSLGNYFNLTIKLLYFPNITPFDSVEKGLRLSSIPQCNVIRLERMKAYAAVKFTTGCL